MRRQSVFDYLIVGQGLAGTCIAWQLHWSKRNFLIVDPGHQTAASRVAAGLVNPLSGPRLYSDPFTPIWLQAARDFYQRIERQLGHTFWTRLKIHRLLTSDRQQKAWAKKQYSPLTRQFITQPPAITLGPVDAPSITTIAATVDIAQCIHHSRTFFSTSGNLCSGRVAAEALTRNSDGHWQWQGSSFRSVIWCQGWEALHNPLISSAELVPVKGEILQLQRPPHFPEHVHHWGHWAIPRQQHLLLGATYTPDVTDLSPTAEGRDRLLHSYKEATGLHPVVTAHHCGIRPTTRGRQPLTFWLDDLPGWGVFNGFGSHGALRMPHASAEFLASADHPPQLGSR